MAINLISPGVKITETDQVASIPASGATVGGVVGMFRWGPVETATLVSSETQLVEKFQTPNSTNASDFFNAANFLSYSGALYVSRANTAGLLNATASLSTADTANAGTGLLIKNEEVYENSFSSGTADDGPWAARYAGAVGNSIKVSTCPSSAAFSSTLTGTFTVSAGSAVVVGTGSAANTEITVGDIVVISGRSINVQSVSNATHFTLATAHLTGATAVSVVRRWEFFDSFDLAPSTSTYALTKSGNISTNDEMHIAVVDEDGLVTGTSGTLIEKFQSVSKASDAKGEAGGNNFYKDVINNSSEYIWWLDKDTQGTNWDTAASATVFTAVAKPMSYSLAGGADGSAPTDGQKILAYDVYKNKASIKIDLIPVGVASATVINTVIADIAEKRKDCVVVFSPELADVQNNVGNEVTDINAFANTVTRSTYAFMDANFKYQYDKYNDVYRYVPTNADTAGCMARTDAETAPWFSPAGFSRGRILNVTRLAFNPNEAERDLLYKNSVNPIFSQPGRGVVLFGDKTFTSKTGSFSRINVRRLFITIQRSIGTFAEDVLFEQNDTATRSLFLNTVEPFLRSVQGGRGITDFRVICDETNNPDDVVNANEFIADIFVRPIASINFIQLNFISVRGAAAFAEIG